VKFTPNIMEVRFLLKEGDYYQLIDEKGKIIPVPPRSKIIVLLSSRIGIRVQCDNQVFAVQKLDKRLKKLQKTIQSTSSSKSKAISQLPTIHGSKTEQAQAYTGGRNMTENL